MKTQRESTAANDPAHIASLLTVLDLVGLRRLPLFIFYQSMMFLQKQAVKSKSDDESIKEQKCLSLKVIPLK